MTQKIVCNQGHDLTLPNALTSNHYRCRICWNEEQKLRMRVRRGTQLDKHRKPYTSRKPRRTAPVLELANLVSHNEELAKYLLMIAKAEQWAKELEVIVDALEMSKKVNN